MKKIMIGAGIVTLLAIGFYGYIYNSFVNSTTKITKEVEDQLIEWKKSDVNLGDSLKMIIENHADSIPQKEDTLRVP